MNTKKVRIVYWKDKNWWIGYIEEYPDYRTEGKTFEELKKNIIDLYKDLSEDRIPFARRVTEIEVA